MGVSDTIGMVKEVVELVRKYNDLPLYQKIVELQGAVVELSGERIGLADKLQQAERRIAQLEEALRVTKVLRVGIDSYWTEDGDGPFCIGCWDTKRSLVRLVRSPGVMVFHTCPSCKTPVHKIGKPGEKDSRRF